MYAGPSGNPSIDGLSSLAKIDFVHHYFVNATPNFGDVDFKRAGVNPNATTEPTSDWRTIVVGGLGKGGRGIYALDVTTVPGASEAEASLASKLLWEYVDEDMGFVYGRPEIHKTRRWGWVVLVESGYNNVNGATAGNRGKGYLYVLNAKTGELLQKISTGEGTATNPSGFGRVSAVVPKKSDGLIDAVYGGDLLGNVWRFDFSSATANVPSPVKIATLADENGVAQPVTSEIRVDASRPAQGSTRRMVFVGTGKYLDLSDVFDQQKQAFYAIQDGTAEFGGFEKVKTFPVARANLEAVTDLLTGVTVDPTTKRGWYYVLPEYVEVPAGATPKRSAERVIFKADVLQIAKKVTFTSVVPASSTDACAPGGKSYTYLLDYDTGRSFLSVKNAAGEVVRTTKIEGAQAVDARLLRIDGRGTRVTATRTSGEVGEVGEALGRVGDPALLNWREIFEKN
jgi:type IV pilus assembly protein PilY1